jgi:hypothetical protein
MTFILIIHYPQHTLTFKQLKLSINLRRFKNGHFEFVLFLNKFRSVHKESEMWLKHSADTFATCSGRKTKKIAKRIVNCHEKPATRTHHNRGIRIR